MTGNVQFANAAGVTVNSNDSPSSQGGAGSKNGTYGPTGSDAAVTGCRGGGGANSTRDGGAPSYGGESYVNIVDYSGTVITSYTLTPPAAVSGAVAGSAGSIKITDSNGTATYTSGSGTHVVA